MRHSNAIHQTGVGSALRRLIRSVLPAPWFSALKSVKQWFLAQVADHFYFPAWLVFQCVCHRQRVVVLHRLAALGDVICTLPMMEEIQKRHPRRRLVFITAAAYKKVVQLSPQPVAVYGACSWKFSVPRRSFGLIEKIYLPRTTDERFKNVGPTCHLIDDFAGSCGIVLNHRQPRLHPSEELIRRTLARHGLAISPSKKRKLIAINGGRSWPVREWSFAQWQQLVDRIHAEYDATILLFGLGGDENEYTRLQGVEVFANHRVLAHEVVALLAACDLLVSIDSGPVHIAGAVGTPVVGLFGAVNPQFRLPPNSPGVGLFADVPCRFCHHENPRGHWKDGCPHDIRCMKELAVPTVFDVVKSMLSQH